LKEAPSLAPPQKILDPPLHLTITKDSKRLSDVGLVFSERELKVHVRYMSSAVRLSVVCL